MTPVSRERHATENATGPENACGHQRSSFFLCLRTRAALVRAIKIARACLDLFMCTG